MKQAELLSAFSYQLSVVSLPLLGSLSNFTTSLVDCHRLHLTFVALTLNPSLRMGEGL